MPVAAAWSAGVLTITWSRATLSATLNANSFRVERGVAGDRRRNGNGVAFFGGTITAIGCNVSATFVGPADTCSYNPAATQIFDVDGQPVPAFSGFPCVVT